MLICTKLYLITGFHKQFFHQHVLLLIDIIFISATFTQRVKNSLLNLADHFQLVSFKYNCQQFFPI